jgi:hypothetical protein
MTGSVGSHTWLVAAAYLAAGVIGGLVLRGLFTGSSARRSRPAGAAATFSLSTIRAA